MNLKHEAYDVYIGRAMPGFKASAFANPFPVGEAGTRAQVIARYRQLLHDSPALMAQVESLRGLRLGCWCKPAPCHGDVLVELLEGPPPAPAQGTLF